MAYSDLKKLKKVEVKNTKSFYTRHLIVGRDLFAWNLFNELRNKKGEDQVQFICTDKITFNDLAPKGPASIRGKDNIELFKNTFSEIEVTESQKPSVFYKDMKFKPFGGRSKSEKLLWSEEFFTGPKVEVKLEEYYPILKSDELFNSLVSKSLELTPIRIFKRTPDDMISPKNWAIECTNGDVYECENIYWGDSPQDFLNIFESKNELTDDFIQFCEGTQAPCSLFVKLVYDQKVTDMEETLFLPLSYTHDWGHFIGEFKNLENGKQSIEFVHYIDKDHSSEEEISRKIRLLKRNLEKIFPEIKKNSYEEFIAFSENSVSLKIDDALFNKSKNDASNVHFFSFNGPLERFAPTDELCEDSCRGVSFLTRAMVNYKTLQEKI